LRGRAEKAFKSYKASSNNSGHVVELIAPKSLRRSARLWRVNFLIWTSLLDTTTIPASKHAIPAYVFYIRTKADILRYESEVASEPTKSQLAARAKSCYTQALSTLRKEGPNLIVRLALKKGKDGLEIAQTALTETAGSEKSTSEPEMSEPKRLQEVIRESILEWTRNNPT
jgi:hypothetical protein